MGERALELILRLNWIRKLNGDAAIFKDLEVGLDCGPLRGNVLTPE
jgi:hypothetical protein